MSEKEIEIVFMRHGKAQDLFEADEDFERNLTSRGKEDVRNQIQLLISQHIVPKKILCSAAFRTISTARIAADLLGIKKSEIIVKSELYLSDFESFLEMSKDVYGNETLLVVGHNPAMGQIASFFSSETVFSFPTASWIFLKGKTGIFKAEKSSIVKKKMSLRGKEFSP